MNVWTVDGVLKKFVPVQCSGSKSHSRACHLNGYSGRLKLLENLGTAEHHPLVLVGGYWPIGEHVAICSPRFSLNSVKFDLMGTVHQFEGTVH